VERKKKRSKKSQILDIEEKAGFTRKKRKMVFFELILCQALWYAFQTPSNLNYQNPIR
jgi:hypothetical protein